MASFSRLTPIVSALFQQSDRVAITLRWTFGLQGDDDNAQHLTLT